MRKHICMHVHYFVGNIVAMQHHVATMVGSYNIIQNVGTIVMLPVVGSYHIISSEHATVAGNMQLQKIYTRSNVRA